MDPKISMHSWRRDSTTQSSNNIQVAQIILAILSMNGKEVAAIQIGMSQVYNYSLPHFRYDCPIT